MRDNMATNKVYCSYQEIIDLHTEPEKVTAIGIHTPTDDTPYKMFEGFFKQFKKYKYVGASVSLVPVATLPVDPLQVDYVGNEGIDPRDVMNPILFHGCHGEDMGTVLNMLIGRDAAISDSLIGMQGNNAVGAPTSEMLLYSLLDELYYKALTDRTWRKAHPQRGFKKSGLRPLLYTLATNRQVAPGSLSDVLGFNDEDDVVAFGGDPTIADRTIINPVTGQEITVPTYATKNNMQLMTPRLTRLGYLDTRNLVTDFTPGVATVDTMVTSENWTRLPKLMMGLILLPPSYKVEMHFRMIVNHYWTFKGFRGISFRNDLLKSPSYFNANEDLFANESGNGNPIPEEIGGDDPDPPTPPTPNVATYYTDEEMEDLYVVDNHGVRTGVVYSRMKWGNVEPSDLYKIMQGDQVTYSYDVDGVTGYASLTVLSTNGWVVVPEAAAEGEHYVSVGQIFTANWNNLPYAFVVYNGQLYQVITQQPADNYWHIVNLNDNPDLPGDDIKLYSIVRGEFPTYQNILDIGTTAISKFVVS